MRYTKKTAGAAVLAAGVLVLTSCSGTSEEFSFDVPDIPAVEELGDTAGEQLDIIAWAGFVEPEWVEPFEQETGCTVNRRVAGTSDEMVQLMRTGDYDLVSASGDASMRLIMGGDVQPLNTDLIPEFGSGDIAEGMVGQLYDTINGQAYGIPIGRGANILQYNTDTVTEEPTSWDVVWEEDTPYAGSIIAYDAPIYIADAAVYLMAHEPELGIENPYALDQEQLDAAIELLRQQSPNVSEYWSDAAAQITSFVGGTSEIGTSWEVLRKLTEDEKFASTLPEEGSTGWSDAWMLHADSDAVNCAYEWMNVTSSPEVNGQIAMNFGMAPANLAFCDSSDEAREHCDYFNAEDEEYFENVWYWTTPIEQCLDGRTDVECTDYQEWTDAWATVRG